MSLNADDSQSENNHLSSHTPGNTYKRKLNNCGLSASFNFPIPRPQTWWREHLSSKIKMLRARGTQREKNWIEQNGKFASVCNQRQASLTFAVNHLSQFLKIPPLIHRWLVFRCKRSSSWYWNGPRLFNFQPFFLLFITSALLYPQIEWCGKMTKIGVCWKGV